MQCAETRSKIRAKAMPRVSELARPLVFRRRYEDLSYPRGGGEGGDGRHTSGILGGAPAARARCRCPGLGPRAGLLRRRVPRPSRTARARRPLPGSRRHRGVSGEGAAKAPAFSTAQRRPGNPFAQRSRALKPALFCEKLARSTSSPKASSTAATDVLWGSTTTSTFMSARTSVSVGSMPLLLACVVDIPTSGGAPYLFRATPHAPGIGGTQAENKPTHLS
jgi:hypothetical protein